mgnify:CR=1 FL=1
MYHVSSLFTLSITIAIPTFAQVGIFKATHINVRATDSEWIGWEKSNVTITWDSNRKHITINSSVPQIIDYVDLNVLQEKDYVTLYSSATDKNYIAVNIYITEYKSGTLIFTIEYSNMQYSYNLQKQL